MSCCGQAVPAMRPAIFVGRIRFKVPPPDRATYRARIAITGPTRDALGAGTRWATPPCAASLPGHLLPLLASVLGPQPAALPHRPDVALRQPQRHCGSPRGNRRSAVRGPAVILALPTLCRIRSSNEFVRPAGEFAGGPCNPVALASVGGASSQCRPGDPNVVSQAPLFVKHPATNAPGAYLRGMRDARSRSQGLVLDTPRPGGNGTTEGRTGLRRARAMRPPCGTRGPLSAAARSGAPPRRSGTESPTAR
jgi:hypothetical protein